MIHFMLYQKKKNSNKHIKNNNIIYQKWNFFYFYSLIFFKYTKYKRLSNLDNKMGFKYLKPHPCE